MIVSPTQTQIMASLRSFLVTSLGVKVFAAQQNRVPEPADSDFVVMTPIRYERLRTNVDTAQDAAYQASISGETMTVSTILIGAVLLGATLFGVGVVANTTIVSQLTGPTGGVGTYGVSISQTVGSSVLASGQRSLDQGAEVTVQLDFHSANDTDAADMAQTVSTLLRDDYGVQQFAGQMPQYGVSPLYADDPVQRPFLNENQQIEWRYVLEAHLQVEQVVDVPQQFFTSTDLTLADALVVIE